MMHRRRGVSDDVRETIEELWNHGIDASHMADEIEQIIDDISDYDVERHWERVARELRLI